MSKYIILDDDAIANGGTNLTILSMIEDRLSEVHRLSTRLLTKEDIINYKDKIWIIGNITHFLTHRQDTGIIDVLFSNINRFVKLEFDYNFCPFRGEIPHEKLGNQKCSCPYGITGNSVLANIYDHITQKANHIFFMSERQRAIFANHLKNLDFSKSSILSSCFSKQSLELIDSLKDTPKNNKYAILEGFGGWHSHAKGTDEAKYFCLVNNIEFNILPVKSYEDHIKTLARYKGLVFLPIIDDTCPRVIIEARLLGLQVITNINSQHTTEYWWKDQSLTKDYISHRPDHFWKIIDNL